MFSKWITITIVIIVIFRSHVGSSPRLFRFEGVARRKSSAGLLP
jgi:hypothetical protein